MTLAVHRDPYTPGVLITGAGPLVALTRAEAEQLRDDLTAALNPAPTDSAQWEYEHGGGAIRSERTTP